MLKLKECGGLLAVHCENDHILQFYRNKYLSEGKKPSPILSREKQK